ncbi:MAG: UDP-N-acetylmuramate dehydrogenase [Nitrospirota bacterium]
MRNKVKINEMEWTEVIKGEVSFVEPMRNHTSLRIGGHADIFVMPEDLQSLEKIIVFTREREIPLFPFGGGTNVLVKDGGIEGVVISLKSFRKIEVLREEDGYVYLSVEAGVPLQRLLNFSKERGYSGIEGLAGIPGTVGGAICGNAGSFGYEMKDVFVSAMIMNSEGKERKFLAEEIDFGYRESGFLPGELILSAEIRLKEERREYVSAKVAEFLKMKLERQPVSELTAGCVFKNPQGLSAGRLIEDIGFKGMRIGDIEISKRHGNFFVNKGKASASDFLKLMEEVVKGVKASFGIILEPEIKIIGRDEVN